MVGGLMLSELQHTSEVHLPKTQPILTLQQPLFPRILHYSHDTLIWGMIQSDERRRGMPNDNKVPLDVSMPFPGLPSFLLSFPLTVSTSTTVLVRLKNAAAVGCRGPAGWSFTFWNAQRRNELRPLLHRPYSSCFQVFDAALVNSNTS